MRERPDGVTIVAGAGSNDTRHAVHLTERASELGVDAVLSVTPYYNRPNRRGILAHFARGRARQRGARGPLQHPAAHRHRHAQRPARASSPRSSASSTSSSPTRRTSRRSPGLRVYAGNDDLFARTLDMGEAGGILVASHIVGPQMRRMVDEPENRAAIDASLRDVYRTLFLTASPTCTKAALELLGPLRRRPAAADGRGRRSRARGGARDARCATTCSQTAGA